MATQLQTAMEGLIAVFHSYSGKEGDKYKLSRGELKNLLQGELADFLSVRIWTEARNWTCRIFVLMSSYSKTLGLVTGRERPVPSPYEKFILIQHTKD